MSFTDQKPRVATAEDLKLNWAGGANGKYFRCGLCGYKFKEGDIYRWIFTNNIPQAGGNPFVCEKCDGDDVISKWVNLCLDYKQKFWWFHRE